MPIIHIQQGGSSHEVYLHVHKDKAEAQKCRESCDNAAYNVSDDVSTKCKLTPGVQRLIDRLIIDAAKLVIGES